MSETMVALVCVKCGAAFTRSKRNVKYDNSFCSRSCAVSFNVRLRQPVPTTHGTYGLYRKGCRCADCKSANTEKIRRYRETSKCTTSSTSSFAPTSPQA